MGVGNYTQSTYIKVKNGAIVITINKENEDNNYALINAAHKVVPYVSETSNKTMLDLYFSYFEGKLVSIEKRKSSINGQDLEQWFVKFNAEDQNYIWNVAYDNINFQSFINSIASLDNPDRGIIKLTPYIKNDKTRVGIRFNGEKINWKYSMDEMPMLEPVMILNKKTKVEEPYIDPKTGKPQLDNSERMEWVETLVNDINSRLKHYTPAIQEVDKDEISIEEVDF